MKGINGILYWCAIIVGYLAGHWWEIDELVAPHDGADVDALADAGSSAVAARAVTRRHARAFAVTVWVV